MISLLLANFFILLWIFSINNRLSLILVFLFGSIFYITFPYFTNFLFIDYLQLTFSNYQKDHNLDNFAFLVSLIYLTSFGFGVFVNKKFLNLNVNKFSFLELDKKDIIYLIVVFLSMSILTKGFVNIPYAGLINFKILFFILCVLFFDKYFSKKLNKFNYFTSFSLFFFILTFFFFIFLASARKDIPSVIIIYFVFIYLNKDKIFLKLQSKDFLKLAFIMPLILPLTYIAFTFITFKRSSHLHDGVYNYEFFNLYFDYLLNSSIFLFSLISYADFMPSFENFKYILSQEKFLNGSSILKIFTSFISRDYWQFKPLGSEILIVREYSNPLVGGTSMSINFFGEIYWNFKLLLGSFFLFFYGALLPILEKKFRTNFLSHKAILLLICVLIFEIWRGAVSNYLLINLLTITFLFICIFLKKNLKKIFNG